MRGIHHFSSLPLPTIKGQVTFFMLLLRLYSHLILNVSVAANFGVLNGFLYCYINFYCIGLIENCGNRTPLYPPSPLGALNINKLFRKWATEKQVVAILITGFPLSLRNGYCTKMLQKANQPSKNQQNQNPHQPQEKKERHKNLICKLL